MSERVVAELPAVSKSRVRFRFVPLPQSALDALAEGEIDMADLAILAFLWRRAPVETRKATATLAQVYEGIAWGKSEDALYRRLVRLQEKGWLNYQTTQGRRGTAYLFALNPNEKRSEPGPMRSGEVLPMREEPEKRTVASDASLPLGGRSDDDSTRSPRAVPMRPPSGPMRELSTRRLVERDSSAFVAPSVPMTSEGSETNRTDGKAKVLGTDAYVEGEGAGPRDAGPAPTTNGRKTVAGEAGYLALVRDSYRNGELDREAWLELVGEHGRRLPGPTDEHAFVAVCSELVASGAAEWRREAAEPSPALCRYPEHRTSDWLSPDGRRLICARCHPGPAVPSA
jgi:hypothetical protein